MISKRRFLSVFLWATPIVGIAGFGGFAGWQWRQGKLFAEMLARPLTTDMQMHIPSGSSLRHIAQIGEQSGAPLSVAEFVLAAQTLGVANKLQAGHYQFSAGTTAGDVITALAQGKVAPALRLTIIEGTTWRDLRKMLQQDIRLAQTLSSKSDHMIWRELRDDALLPEASRSAEAPDANALSVAAQLNLSQNQNSSDDRSQLKSPLDGEWNGESLEGMFLPETYFFQRGDSDLDVLRRAWRGMQTTLDELWDSRADGGIFKNKYEALTLASIVEKETGAAEERPLIASVFVNRLKKNIPLQADPTVIYGLGEQFDGNLTRAHLRDKENLFNTYRRRGLTPTPIALPGKAAIAAVLNPPETKYYYFVATGDGKHKFSATLREHNNAVNKYQRRRR